MKVISFVLYGNLPMYDNGIFRNIALAKELFPEWECWIYVPKNYHLVSSIAENENSRVIEKEPIGFSSLQKLWRFLPFFDKDIEVTINRDCDARLTQRDRSIVRKFEDSDYSFQVLQDHFLHLFKPILAGMNGGKPAVISELLYEDYVNFTNRSFAYEDPTYDEIFLAEVAHKLMPHSMICNDLPVANKTCDIGLLEEKHMFIGNKFDQNDLPIYSRDY